MEDLNLKINTSADQKIKLEITTTNFFGPTDNKWPCASTES